MIMQYTSPVCTLQLNQMPINLTHLPNLHLSTLEAGIWEATCSANGSFGLERLLSFPERLPPPYLTSACHRARDWAPRLLGHLRVSDALPHQVPPGARGDAAGCRSLAPRVHIYAYMLMLMHFNGRPASKVAGGQTIRQRVFSPKGAKC